MTDIDDLEALRFHRACIVSWLWGYRMGRSKSNILSPGWPKDRGWLVVASYCRVFMREEYKVLCTIADILDTWNRHIIDSSTSEPPISSEVLRAAPEYETLVASGFRAIM